MRTLPLVLLFATLGARSPHHELRLERNVVSAEQIAYDVTVVNLDSGKTVLNAHLTGKPGEALEASGDDKGQTVRVRLAYSAHFFSATVNVIDGKTIADEFRTWWQVAPQQATVAPPPQTSTLNTAGALRVGGDVKAPVLTYRVEPKYTDEARANRISGIVNLQVLVGKDGRVKDAVVLRGLPYGLSESALDSIRKWEFRPATRNGEPVDAIFDITFSYSM